MLVQIIADHPNKISDLRTLLGSEYRVSSALLNDENNRGLSLGRGSRLHDPRSRSDLRHRRHTSTACHGHPGQAYCTGLTLAEWLCRTADRIDPARVFGPHRCAGRSTFAPDSKILRSLL